MLVAALAKSGELLVTILIVYAVLALISKSRLQWAQAFRRRRGFVLWVVVLLVFLVHVSEDVLARESGPVDEALLTWIHRAMPTSMTPFFQALTLSASVWVLLPLVGVAVIVLLRMRQRRLAVAVASTALVANLFVYLVKTAVDRTRPALWDTQWYWGSSFPSGHTLSSAAFATAICLCVARLRPRLMWPAFGFAALWVLLVALSRLVLGVHWPTDVMAAAAAGVLLSLAVAAVVQGPPVTRDPELPP